MTTKPRKWVDYDRKAHGNPFEFVLMEATRRRFAMPAEQAMFAKKRVK